MHLHCLSKSAPMAPSLRLFPLALLVILHTMPLPSSWGSLFQNHDTLMLGKFHRWMSVHNRSYSSEDEKLRRFEVYSHNVKYIEDMNMNGGLGYELGENEFTDLTNEEFRARYTGGNFMKGDDLVVDAPIITTLSGDVHEGRDTMEDKDNIGPPDFFDWREMGAVTPAKKQNGCGSCWAMAAVAVLEAQTKIKTGELLDLSEQELVDCDDRDHGCWGGLPARAFEWIKEAGGVVTESSYPYVGYEGFCRIKEGVTRVAKITDIVKLPRSEWSIRDAVLKTPVAVGIDSRDLRLQHFKNGIYTGPCGWALDHAVVIVGYGGFKTPARWEMYWIVKNSWGQSWGEDGFFRMRRGYDPNGLCGIAMEAVYALI